MTLMYYLVIHAIDEESDPHRICLAIRWPTENPKPPSVLLPRLFPRAVLSKRTCCTATPTIKSLQRVAGGEGLKRRDFSSENRKLSISNLSALEEEDLRFFS
ncbi:hypothetical protein MRB53_014810 [Persea americana]|uniref:Uncharacterized protein n=1 Tax=Persea americana TaxID=3435 RepID=A0ACC2KBT1_PERAE|nr:hypothetical protein MRB53_014810 [Persea americana]